MFSKNCRFEVQNALYKKTLAKLSASYGEMNNFAKHLTDYPESFYLPCQ